MTDRSAGFSILRRRGAWRDALRRRMLAIADVISLLTAWAVCDLTNSPIPALSFAVMGPVWLILSKLYGLYDTDHRALRHLTVDELPPLIAWATTGSATFFAVSSILGGHTVSAPSGVAFWAALVVVAPVARAASRALWRRTVPPERALLVGSGQLEEATLRKLELFEDIHVECAGVLDDGTIATAVELDEAMVPLAAELRRLGRVDRIIVASQHVNEMLIAAHVALCRQRGLKLSVVPPARGMFGTAVHLTHIADLPMIEYSTWDVSRSSVLVKRCFDLVISATALILLAPVLLAVAALVRASSSGPALFIQSRAGLGGRPFRMWKFRTMASDAEARLTDVMDVSSLSDPMFKLRKDPRVTRVGRILRRTSIDELPQLFNVLTGSMSLVGPRPEQLDLVERYGPEHWFRLRVKPGMTGPMQVYGRGELRFDERLAVEREYVENLSLRRDLRLLLLTFAAVLRGRGAF